MNNTQWRKVISLKYRSTSILTIKKFKQLISEIEALAQQKIQEKDDDFFFNLEIDNCVCIAAIVLFDRNKINECQFTVLSNDLEKPKNVTLIDPIHQLIQKYFLI